MISNPQHIADLDIVRNLEGGAYEVQQNGIDLTLESLAEITGGISLINEKEIFKNKEVLLDEDNCYTLEANKAYAVEFQQEVSVPGSLCASVVQRSTLNRMGTFIISGLYDSGFKNRIGAVLRASAPIKIQKGSRVAQIIFQDASAASLYDGSYQGK
jgi:deoxycytidine triphosphate deaminase